MNMSVKNILSLFCAALPGAMIVSAHAEFSAREFGQDWWPYGLEANRTCIETLIRYCREQALIDRELLAHELFHPASHALTG